MIGLHALKKAPNIITTEFIKGLKYSVADGVVGSI